MAAGVGKTYRMLQEGRQAQEQGRDVVIGYLEPHDRPETAALAEGLEVVPRLRTAHGGARARGDGRRRRHRAARPSSRSSTSSRTRTRRGMRNEKRYQDIDEILDAGIDVISTVNVQHLESLNDAIFELTGVRVRETFPDRILDEADEVVLVDLSPEELQERLRAGKVYPKERAEVALENFFRHENLAALRELVLREVAEDVEARRQPAALEPLSQQAVAERILALIEPQPKSQRILRRAWRSAQRLGAEIDALWVRPPGLRADRRGGDAARRAPPARERPRDPLPRGGRRRPRRDGAARRRRARLDLHLRRHARRAPARARSFAARCSRGWCASSPASTSASSPTGRCREEQPR